MGAGRPTKLTPNMMKLAQKYVDEKKKLFKTDALTRLPSVAELALELEIPRRTLYQWADANQEFHHILEWVMNLQEQELTQKGLDGQYNPTITKLMLSKHGYRDSQEVTGKDGGPIQVEGVEIRVRP